MRDISPKLIFLIVATIFLGSVLYNSLLDDRFVQYAKSPDFQSDRVVPYHVKGTYVYVTAEQSRFVYWLRVVEIGSGILFFAGCFLAQRRNQGR